MFAHVDIRQNRIFKQKFLQCCQRVWGSSNPLGSSLPSEIIVQRRSQICAPFANMNFPFLTTRFHRFLENQIWCILTIRQVIEELFELI